MHLGPNLSGMLLPIIESSFGGTTEIQKEIVARGLGL